MVVDYSYERYTVNIPHTPIQLCWINIMSNELVVVPYNPYYRGWRAASLIKPNAMGPWSSIVIRGDML